MEPTKYVDMSADHGAEAAIAIPDNWRDVPTSEKWFDSGWINGTLYNDYTTWIAAGGPDIIAIVDAFADAQHRSY